MRHSAVGKLDLTVFCFMGLGYKDNEKNKTYVRPYY